MAEAGLVEIFGALGSIATVVALGTAVFDLRSGQRWKRAEFVAGLVKEWEGQPGVRAVFKMLDYRGKEMTPSDYGGKTKEAHRMTSAVLAKALELPEQRRHDGLVGTASYTELEHDIRDFFDQFLEGVHRFQQHIAAKLVRDSEFDPYLQYWCGKLGNSSVHDTRTLKAIRDFAKQYYPDGATFFEAYGVSFVAPGTPATDPAVNPPT